MLISSMSCGRARASRDGTRYVLAAFAFASIALVAGCGKSPVGQTGAPPAPVTLFAAASLTPALEDITTLAASRGVALVVSSGSSADLARQIEHGAPADLYFSAHPLWSGHLEKLQKSEARADLLSNRLCVIVPSNSALQAQSSPAFLATDAVHRISIGDPVSVPGGVYARESLTRLALWTKVESKVVPALDAQQALLHVEQQAADAGIAYHSDTANNTRIRVIYTFPEDPAHPILYPLLLLLREHRAPQAQAAYDLLQSPEAQAIYQRHGFNLINKGTK